MMYMTNCGIPGVMIVAPTFDFYDAADAAKVIEDEVGMTATYKDHSVMGRICAIKFAKDNIPWRVWL